MKNRLTIASLALLLTPSLYAFPCYITMVKEDCWTNYELTVNVLDTSNNASVAKVVVPKGKSWMRQSFECKPAQTFMYEATFTPTIWERDKAKKYHARRYWSLPDKIADGATAWNIKVCYASDFTETPMPPEATGKCQCHFDQVPAVEPR